jgi:hypothetical protein
VCAVVACSVSDAPFVFLNAGYIKRSTECHSTTSTVTSIHMLVLISFATSAALLGFVFMPLLSAVSGRTLGGNAGRFACRYKATQLTKLKGLIAHGKAIKARREELTAMLPAAHSVAEWSIYDVGEWVGRTAGLEDIRGALEANGVDGITLLLLEPNDASAASRLALPSQFVFRHLCLHRDGLIASLAQSAPTTSAVDALMLEALLSQPRGFRERLYALIRPRRRFHAPQSPRRARQHTDGDFELADAVPGTTVLAPRDRPAILTGVC